MRKLSQLFFVLGLSAALMGCLPVLNDKGYCDSQTLSLPNYFQTGTYTFFNAANPFKIVIDTYGKTQMYYGRNYERVQKVEIQACSEKRTSQFHFIDIKMKLPIHSKPVFLSLVMDKNASQQERLAWPYLSDLGQGSQYLDVAQLQQMFTESRILEYHPQQQNPKNLLYVLINSSRATQMMKQQVKSYIQRTDREPAFSLFLSKTQ